MNKIRVFKASSSLIIAIIIIILVISTPLSLLFNATDPYYGVLTSSNYGTAKTIELKSPFLKNRVTIVFDKYWIPQVFAEDERDACFAVGFLHASYRLWEMDMERRMASGRLAEIIGKAGIKNDIFMRTIGLRRSAEATVNWFKKNNSKIYGFLEAYSEGVNYAISGMEKSHSLPLMFKLLGYKPDPWTPTDTIVWSKYMAWSLTNFWNPLAYSYLASKLGANDTNVLYPVHPYFQDNVTVMPGNGSINGKEISINPYYLRKLNWFSTWATGINFSAPMFSSKIGDAVLSILELAGESPKELGSNDWAISPSKSITGDAIMANDPHLHLSLPSVWYAVRIKVGNDMDVYGVTLLGIPFIIIGHNRYISWGLTDTETGVMDFYVEKVDPNNPGRYYYNGKWLDMKHIEETINVKGGKTIRLMVNLTVHGPVLTDRGLTISLKWTGNAGFKDDNSGVTREALAAYFINKAKSLHDFLNALRYWDVPSQNFMYADVKGNIAVIEPGLFPLRKVTIPTGQTIYVESSRSVLNGTGEYEWIKYIPYDDVPHSINPERGFLAAPNQMSVGPYYPYFILGGWWDPGSRAHRIFMDLQSKDKHDVKDMMSYQSDTFDWYAYSVLGDLISAVNGKVSGDAAKAVDILRSWDYRMDKDKVASTIWWAWFSTLQDEMYKSYFLEHSVNRRFYPTPDTTIWLIKNMKKSKWFKNGFDSTVTRALESAISALKKKLGDNMNEWKWGNVHKLYLEHLSGLKTLSGGPYPEDGGSNILMAAGFPYDINALNEKVYVSTGPSWRIIAEMRNGSMPNVYGIYPGGQSGNPATEHYEDLVGLWLNYQYIKIEYVSSPEELTNSTATIILEPGGG